MSSIDSTSGMSFTQGASIKGPPHHHDGRRKAEMEAALTSAGVDPSKMADIEKQLKTAMKSARVAAASSSDPRKTMDDAMDKVLADNGVDVTKFRAAMESQHAAHAKGGPNGDDPDHDGDHHGAPRPLPPGTPGAMVDTEA
jgi:hypothetical protein